MKLLIRTFAILFLTSTPNVASENQAARLKIDDSKGKMLAHSAFEFLAVLYSIDSFVTDRSFAWTLPDQKAEPLTTAGSLSILDRLEDEHRDESNSNQSVVRSDDPKAMVDKAYQHSGSITSKVSHHDPDAASVAATGIVSGYPPMETTGNEEAAFDENNEKEDEGEQEKEVASHKKAQYSDDTASLVNTNIDKEGASGLVAHANSIESFQLRAVASLDTLKIQVADARINGDKSDLARATANAIRSSAGLMEEAKVKSLAMFAHLQEHEDTEESNGWSTQLQTNYQSAMAQINRALELFPKMISYLEGSSRESNEKEQTKQDSFPAGAPIEENQGESMVDKTSTYRRGLQDASQAQTPQEINLDVPPSASDMNKATSSESRQKEKEAARHRRILRSRFEGNHRAQSHFDHFTKLHDTFQHGDHDGMHRHLGPIQSRVTRNRSLNQNQRHLWSDDQNAKARQCEILMNCVGKMSIYDMILFFYSDDIDPNNGKIDDNIYIHTEAPDVYEVYNNDDVADARTDLQQGRFYGYQYFRGSGKPQWCDRTLRLFSRNVEYGDIPHWEGGTVADVCHAQGGHTYVQLDQVATKVGFKAADEIAKEMFDCSKRLYNCEANPRNSPFPFAREQKLAIDTGASLVVEEDADETTTQDSKSKLFDGSTSGNSHLWQSRDGSKGYTMRLNFRSDRGLCVDWKLSSSENFLHAHSCHDDPNQKWYYEPGTHLISGISLQKWKRRIDDDGVLTHGMWNEGKDKCLQKQDDFDIIVNGCDERHTQDLLQVTNSDFFGRVKPPTVLFKIQLDSHGGSSGHESNTVLKAIELKWRNGEECPQNKISLLSGFSGDTASTAILFDRGETIVSDDGTVLTQTLLPSSSTASRFRIKCSNPDIPISLYEILVFGIVEGGNGDALPEFQGEYEDSFFVPTGIETENSRDDYGQVKVGTYKKVWDNWLRHEDDNLRRKLRQTYLSPYPNPWDDNMRYDNSDFYMGLVREAESNDNIHYQIVIAFARHHGRSFDGDAFEDRDEEYNEFHDKISHEYASIQRGINLVFGKDASVGYICGVEGVVTRHDEENADDGDKVANGTWCPTPTDCSVLKDCVDQEMINTENEGKSSYKAYLQPGAVENATDFDDCGDSREYFGYDPTYKLHNTKNFGFLDEFYSQGTPAVDPGSMGGGGGYGNNFQPNANDYTHSNIDTAAWDELFNVDTKLSQTDLVQDAGISGGLLFGFGRLYNFAVSTLFIVLIIMNYAYDIWEFSIAEKTEIGNVGPIEAWEILQVQHQNNKRMYEGMRSTFEAAAKVDNNLEGLGDLVASLVAFLGNDDGDSYGKVNTIISKLESLEETCEGRRALMDVSPSTAQNAGCDGSDQDGDGVIDNCEEDKYDGETQHVEGEVFSSAEKAVASVRGALSVVDDCAGVKDLVLNLTVKGITAASRLAPGKKMLYVGDLHEFFDAGLFLQVEDSCSDKVDLDVTIKSNELDMTGPSAILSLSPI
ncbi:unknown protein [Seminavis robusta]|uniref:Ricin B lectin domain-containing protein n=1 Tax=Seminavis robusta TaxID=568900 RepID=A0A9N8E2A0_9STRA|nr:unknown protein [Seminavis robusta]|eukprot:Sro576_g169540.1 n/a (1485) ;mRNA; f:35208-42369